MSNRKSPFPDLVHVGELSCDVRRGTSAFIRAQHRNPGCWIRHMTADRLQTVHLGSSCGQKDRLKPGVPLSAGLIVTCSPSTPPALVRYNSFVASTGKFRAKNRRAKARSPKFGCSGSISLGARQTCVRHHLLLYVGDLSLGKTGGLSQWDNQVRTRLTSKS